MSPSNLTKCCACHEKWHGKISKQMCKNRWNVISNEGTIREWSENDPTMIRAWKRKPQPASQPRLLFDLTTSIFYCKIQRFAPNLTFKHSPSAAPATKSSTWTSPNTRLPRKVTLELHQILHLPRKVTLELHQVLHLPQKVTLDLHQILPLPRKVTLELHQILPLPRKVTLELHRVLPLPRKVTRIVHPRDIWSLIYNARSNQCHPTNSPNTAPATQNDHLTCGRNVRKTSETSFPMRGRSENDPRMIRAWSEHENANRNPPRKWGYFSRSPGAFSIVKYNVSSPILHSNMHQVLRLPQKVTLDLHGILPLPRQVTLDLHRILPLPRKVTLDLHRILPLPQKYLYSTWLYSTWHYSSWLNLTLLYLTLLYLTLLYLTLLYLTLLNLTLLYWTLLLLDSTLLDTTLIDLTWLYSTWLYSTWLYSTWLYSTWLYSTWLYSTGLDSTWLYSIWLYSTWLYSTWL